MNRRRFIKLASLTSIALAASGNIYSRSLVEKNSSLISVLAPNIHVRHGQFNLQSGQVKGLHIQRDIFNHNGLQTISKDRIVSVKVSEQNQDFFGVCDNGDFKSDSKSLSAIQLKANILILIPNQ